MDNKNVSLRRREANLLGKSERAFHMQRRGPDSAVLTGWKTALKVIPILVTTRFFLSTERGKKGGQRQPSLLKPLAIALKIGGAPGLRAGGASDSQDRAPVTQEFTKPAPPLAEFHVGKLGLGALLQRSQRALLPHPLLTPVWINEEPNEIALRMLSLEITVRAIRIAQFVARRTDQRRGVAMAALEAQSEALLNAEALISCG